MPEDLLVAADLRVNRNGRRILDDVSLTIPAAAKLLIQGESGAGKTTLFDVLGLLQRPDAGTLEIDATEASELSERERATLRREAIGIVFQEFQLIPDLTARENARVPQDHRGSHDEAWLDTLFAELGIQHVADASPATLSGGEKQRVAIARALANRPRVILADEPTGQLDPATAEQVLELFLEARQLTDAALVVVSHDRRLVDAFETVYRLDDGSLEGPSSPNP